MNRSKLFLIVLFALVPKSALAVIDSCATGGPCGIEITGSFTGFDTTIFGEVVEEISDEQDFVATLTWDSMEAVESPPDAPTKDYLAENGELTVQAGQSLAVFSNLDVLSSIAPHPNGDTTFLIDFRAGGTMGLLDLSNENALASTQLGDALVTIDGMVYSDASFFLDHIPEDPDELRLSRIGSVTSTRLVPESTGPLVAVLALCVVPLRRRYGRKPIVANQGHPPL